jgi:sec-independent protein translocase protein TatC
VAPADPNNATFFEHIDELRGRLIRVLAVVLLAMLLAFGFKEALFEFFKLPLLPLTAKHPDVLAALSPLEMFLVYLKLSFVAGLFVTFPYVLWQLWGFVSPALTAREKKAVVPFMFAGTLAFLAGAAFCFYLVLPVGLEVLHGMLPNDVRATYSVSSYFGMTSLMTFVFGLVFDLPVLMVLLARVGILHPVTVARSRKAIVVGLFVLGAMLTPPDPWTQVMLAGPMWILFEVGLIVSRMVVAVKPPPSGDTLPPDERRRG